jgi:Zn finger protein HypA/HybF involved in hydrogenase expression
MKIYKRLWKKKLNACMKKMNKSTQKCNKQKKKKDKNMKNKCYNTKIHKKKKKKDWNHYTRKCIQCGQTLKVKEASSFRISMEEKLMKIIWDRLRLNTWNKSLRDLNEQ